MDGRRISFEIWIVAAVLLTETTAFAQSKMWRKKMSNAGYAVGVNPSRSNYIYAEGAPGTLYVSYDGGNNWTGRGAVGISAIRQIYVHPADTATLFCATAGLAALRRSTDSGISWVTAISSFGIDGESIINDPAHSRDEIGRAHV